MGSLALFAALLAAAAPSQQPPCEPAPGVQRALEEAAPPGFARADVEGVLASLRAVRARFPSELFVHARFQDAVVEAGTEGHLKAMVREYQILASDRPGETLYEYLAGRAHLGRGTKHAASAMERILERDPSYAPALRTLAEIHASARFGDPAKERREREAFAALCPASKLAHRPSPVGARAPVFEKRAATAVEIGLALEADQSRMMRMRLFDWYTDEEKARELSVVQADCWRAWRLLVEHHRREGDPVRADEILTEMEGRLARMKDRNGPLYALASGIVLALRSPTGVAADLR